MAIYRSYIKKQPAIKYTLRVALKNAPVPIWRKFEVPSNISLVHLSQMIIQLFGWNGYHLYSIRACGMSFSPKDEIEISKGSFFEMDEEPMEKYSIQNILNCKGKKVTLEYDFGDSWEHTITLSSFAEYEKGESHDIVFKGGKGACPPEDCGGVWGYAELLEILEKKKKRIRLNEEEKSFLEWSELTKDFDPEYFDKENCEFICEMFSK